ncbi:MAG: hypothetical protein LBI78_05220 [Campylobacteraceae bacterium]|nr:hypothetical protein [Campylobacteraceae bacterium]
MVRPKGFGKKYFTLSSIQAHSCAAKLHSTLVSICLFFTKTNKDKESSGKNDPPTECESLLDSQNLYYFICSFLKRVQKVLKTKKAFHKFYNRLYYGFRRSGIHPPKLCFIHFFQINFITCKG